MNNSVNLFSLLTLILSSASILEVKGLHLRSFLECSLPAGAPACDSMVQSRSRSPNQTGSNAQIRLCSKLQIEAGTFPMGKIIIRKMPVVAPRGMHAARFVGAENVNKTETGELCNRLVITVELLDTKDGSGKPFKVPKTYNLDGRGPTAFSEDYASWSGVTLTPEELDGFDPDSLLLNKLAKVEITHRVDGKELVPVIAAFHPAEVATPVDV